MLADFKNSYALKWYEARRTKHQLGGQILYSGVLYFDVLYGELHIIFKRRNFDICEHSIFLKNGVVTFFLVFSLFSISRRSICATIFLAWSRCRLFSASLSRSASRSAFSRLRESNSARFSMSKIRKNLHFFCKIYIFLVKEFSGFRVAVFRKNKDTQKRTEFCTEVRPTRKKNGVQHILNSGDWVKFV